MFVIQFVSMDKADKLICRDILKIKIFKKKKLLGSVSQHLYNLFRKIKMSITKPLQAYGFKKNMSILVSFTLIPQTAVLFGGRPK